MAPSLQNRTFLPCVRNSIMYAPVPSEIASVVLMIVYCGQCDLFVDLYTPRMMEQLENITPQEFCQMTRMCKPPKMVMAGNDCATCQFVILEIKIKLKDPKTQVCHWDADYFLQAQMLYHFALFCCSHDVYVLYLISVWLAVAAYIF